jgi:hypothetical protein
LVVALAASCKSFDEAVVVQQPVVAVEEEVVAVVEVVVVVQLHQDLNLNLMNEDDYYVMIDNLIHHLFVAK